jgi:SET domain-containing protein
MLFVSPKIIVDDSPIQGRGVFAVDYILKDEMIEECHFVKLIETDFEKLDKTIKDIAFAWPMFTSGTHAIVLGFGSIYNHSNENNATWETDLEKNCFRFIAVRDIEPGEEICTNYLKIIDF